VKGSSWADGKEREREDGVEELTYRRPRGRIEAGKAIGRRTKVAVEDGLEVVEEEKEVSSAGMVSRVESALTSTNIDVAVLMSDVERELANLSGEGE
jgi:hypothetical protein